MPFIDPKALARVSRMELVGLRQAVEGFLSGRHPSPYYGSSVEYADHRPYGLGDEIRTLDWKLLAKTDKLYVKLFEEQTNVRSTVMVDVSRSMAFGGDKDSGRMNKAEYARHLAAALAYLMLKQNDAVGLAMYDRQLRHYLPARSTATHFRHMVDVLEEAEPEHESATAPVMHELASRLKRRGLVILISDLIDDVEAMMKALGHFRHFKHEVIVFHVMDPDELNFPYDRLTRFKDMESPGMIVANPSSVRKRYLQRLDKFLTTVRGGCLERDISYHLARTDDPWEKMLTAFLGKRARMTS